MEPKGGVRGPWKVFDPYLGLLKVLGPSLDPSPNLLWRGITYPCSQGPGLWECPGKEEQLG